jgi:aminoglycoside 3'-phosphotransferase II
MERTSLVLERLLASATVLAKSQTRLDGIIWHIESTRHGKAFVKVGTHQARTELLREHSALTVLARLLPIARVLSFHDDGKAALLCTSAIDGVGLHSVVATIGRNATLDLLAAALTQLRSVPASALSALAVGVAEELSDIRRLLDGGAISRATFFEHAGVDPYDVFEPLASALLDDGHDTLTHGDLCLPNIIVASNSDVPFLIDWGKAGRGSRSRDMASLRFSMSRNLDDAAFADLAARVDFDIRREADTLDRYRMLDYYWYSATEQTSGDDVLRSS